jgi:hypothetical protein
MLTRKRCGIGDYDVSVMFGRKRFGILGCRLTLRRKRFGIEDFGVSVRAVGRCGDENSEDFGGADGKMVETGEKHAGQAM